MEVLKTRSDLLTNAEVFKLLQEVTREEKRQKKPRLQKLSTILYETTRYLERTPCVLQDLDTVKELFRAVSEFGLTKAETLQLLNTRPETPVEIQLIVEECEERLSEQRVDELLGVVKSVLATPPVLPCEKSQKNHNDKSRKFEPQQ